MSIDRQDPSRVTSPIKLETIDVQRTFRAMVLLMVGTVVPTSLALMIASGSRRGARRCSSSWGSRRSWSSRSCAVFAASSRG